MSRKDGIRVIKTAELYEISIVNIPANPLASVTGFKSLGVQDYGDLPTMTVAASLTEQKPSSVSKNLLAWILKATIRSRKRSCMLTPTIRMIRQAINS